ncbi:MAG: AI-2E family transporter [Lachnospiraceae bacterium]|nr:AI-2E family transporter [Lachnospiraceae bacterium]
MRRWEIYLEMIVEVISWIVGISLLIYGLPKLLGFFWPFVVSWIVTLLARPLCNFIEKKLKISRKWGSVLVVVLSICFVAGIIISLGYLIGSQAMDWAVNLPHLYQGALERLNEFNGKVLQSHISAIPKLDEVIHKMIDSASSGLSSLVSNIGSYGVKHAGTMVKGLTNGLIGTIVMLLSSYLLICDRDEIIQGYEKIMPDYVKEKVSIFCNNTLGVLVSYCMVQLKLMIVIWAILWVGFLILRIEYSFLFAFLISLLDVLPFLGTGTALIPWAIYMAITGRVATCVGFLILYVICLVLKQALQPKMMGDRMELNALVTLILMYTGLKLKGVTGLIFALIFGIFFTNLYKRGAFDSTINRFKYRMTLLHNLDKENK